MTEKNTQFLSGPRPILGGGVDSRSFFAPANRLGRSVRNDKQTRTVTLWFLPRFFGGKDPSATQLGITVLRKPTRHLTTKRIYTACVALVRNFFDECFLAEFFQFF